MKKALFIVFVYSLVWVVTSCGNQSKNNQETHVHQDGTVHEGEYHHENEELDVPEQESFVVGEDSTEIHEHHDHDGHDHDHDHSH